MSGHIDILEDKNTSSLSILYTDTIENYTKLVNNVYKNQGGIEGQRRPVKTKTGIRIRRRMVEDIKKGTILPPITIGAVVNDVIFKKISLSKNSDSLLQVLNELGENNLSIIDGMQRTTALIEANEDLSINHHPIRLEVWVAKSIDSLIYRMLILNTGQIPWDIKRQLQTIYKPILEEVRKQIEDIHIFEIDDQGRRSQSGQFQSSRIVEYFLSYTSRKTNVDTKEKVADDFARMDAAEATSKDTFLVDFIETLKVMVDIDHIFSKCLIPEGIDIEGKISNGRDIFTSAPAGHGFIAAAAVNIYGRPGIEYDMEKVKENKQDFLSKSTKFIQKISKYSGEEIFEFLDLIGLNEKLSARSGKVGEFEREFYFKAFQTLFEEGDNLPSMSPCWEAY